MTVGTGFYNAAVFSSSTCFVALGLCFKLAAVESCLRWSGSLFMRLLAIPGTGMVRRGSELAWDQCLIGEDKCFFEVAL